MDGQSLYRKINNQSIIMPNTKFLEKYPLYTKFKMELQRNLDHIPKPPIHMLCQICDSEQTFNMRSPYEPSVYTNDSVCGKVYLARYTCAGCHSFERDFLLKFDNKLEYVMKVGQNPAQDIDTDKELGKMLGEHIDLFKKGRICESQGYGIGAYAYFRRIIELIIDELLDSIKYLLTDEERKKYEMALTEAKKTKVTEQKIEIVKDLLPPILRPSGMNPLIVLHGILSQGIHEKSDEECIELSEQIKSVLIFLVNQIIISRESSKSFTDGMKKILESKQKK